MRESHMLEIEGCRPWCLRCRRPGTACLCAEISSVRSRTKFVFLTHPKEARKTKNGSGRLAHLGLPGSELIVGIDFTRHPRVVELLADPRFHCRLLYPTPMGYQSPHRPRATATPVIFVVDATWQCAKKMVRLSRNLHALPRIGLQVDRPSRFLIKHQPHPRCLATVEAVDRILVALAAAGEEEYGAEDSARLLRPFHYMNALAVAHAAAPGRKKYRPGRPFKRPEERVRGRTSTKSGRNLVFQG